MQYVIYADESDAKGLYFSNFYGGVLVRSTDLQAVTGAIQAAKAANNLFKEVKWQKVTELYLDKYIALMNVFFDLVREERVKVRIMFTQNAQVAVGLSPRHHRDKYHILYYQFIKHAFGLKYSEIPATVRVYLDTMPCSREQSLEFSRYLVGLNQTRDFRDAGIVIDANQVAEVRSHDHDLMQCLDVVLGAIQFRLNDKHKLKPEGSARRGSRTIAKEKLYRLISERIRDIYPNFNIGSSTGRGDEPGNVWKHPYRHWKFMPTEYEIDESQFKP